MEDRFEELVHVAGTLAIHAREETEASHVKIAASLPPLEASYINEFELTFHEMVAQYSELMSLLDPYVEIYLGETLSTIQEARAVLTAAQNRDKLIWISWTLQDHGSTLLRGNESLEQAIGGIQGFSVNAILINCCTPDSIDASLPTLQSSGIQFGAYANGFVEIPNSWESNGDVDQIASRADLSPSVYSEHVKNWLEAGMSIVGGCCEVSPAHIAHIRETLNEIG